MTLRRIALAGLAAAAALTASGAEAHHAFNMYDNAKYVPLDATVVSFTWQNPHAMLQVMAALPDGTTEAWTVECSAPNIIGRRGWSAKSLKAGDKVPLVLHPMKNGAKYGLMVKVTTPSGQVLNDKM